MPSEQVSRANSDRAALNRKMHAKKPAIFCVDSTITTFDILRYSVTMHSRIVSLCLLPSWILLLLLLLLSQGGCASGESDASLKLCHK